MFRRIRKQGKFHQNGIWVGASLVEAKLSKGVEVGSGFSESQN